MKKTTVQYFCDRCRIELEYPPRQEYEVLRCFDSYGWQDSNVNLTIQYARNCVVNYDSSMLCNQCKIDALEELLKKLKKEKEQSR